MTTYCCIPWNIPLKFRGTPPAGTRLYTADPRIHTHTRTHRRPRDRHKLVFFHDVSTPAPPKQVGLVVKTSLRGPSNQEWLHLLNRMQGYDIQKTKQECNFEPKNVHFPAYAGGPRGSHSLFEIFSQFREDLLATIHMVRHLPFCIVNPQPFSTCIGKTKTKNTRPLFSAS